MDTHAAARRSGESQLGPLLLFSRTLSRSTSRIGVGVRTVFLSALIVLRLIEIPKFRRFAANLIESIPDFLGRVSFSDPGGRRLPKRGTHLDLAPALQEFVSLGQQ